MAGISIIIRAKNAASATFDRVKGDVKSMSDDTARAASGMKAAHEAVAKAMRGDLVGAAQSATAAFKTLFAVMLANPILAVVAAIVALAAGTAMLIQKKMEAAKAAKEQADAEANLRKEAEFSADAIRLRMLEMEKGSFKDRVKSEAKEFVASEDDGAVQSRIASLKFLRDITKLAAQESIDAWQNADETMKASRKTLMDQAIAAWDRSSQAVDAYESAVEDAANAEAKAAEAAEKEAEKRTKIEEKAAEELNAIVDEAFAEYEKAQDERAQKTEDILGEISKLEQEAADEQKRLAWEVYNERVAAAKAAKEAATAKMDTFNTASTMALRKAARDEQRETGMEAKRKEHNFKRALDQAERGATGKHITAALEAKAAQDVAVAAGIAVGKPPAEDPQLVKLDAIKTAIDQQKTELQLLNSNLVGG
jgi:hypothetical protein